MDNTPLLEITPEHIKEKKEIGRLRNNKVFHILTTGGWNCIMVGSAEPKLLGMGPHKMLAKYISQKMEPDIQFTELEKSEEVNLEYFKHLIPKYEALTIRAIKLQTRK